MSLVKMRINQIKPKKKDWYNSCINEIAFYNIQKRLRNLIQQFLFLIRSGNLAKTLVHP